MPAHPRAGNFRRVTSQIFPVVDVQGKEAEPLSYVRFINLDRLLTSDWDVAEGSIAPVHETSAVGHEQPLIDSR